MQGAAEISEKNCLHMIGISESRAFLVAIMSVLSHFWSEGDDGSLCPLLDPPLHSGLRVERQCSNSAEQSWQWVTVRSLSSDELSVRAWDPLTRLHHRYTDALVLIRSIIRPEFVTKTSTVSSGIFKKTPLHWVVDKLFNGSGVSWDQVGWVDCLNGQVFHVSVV